MSHNINNQKDNKEEDKIDLNKLEFTRSNIESLSSKINKFDSYDNGLDLFCYVNCKNSDHDFIKKCHGVVFNNDKLILNSFPYTTEYTFRNNQKSYGMFFVDALNYRMETDEKFENILLSSDRLSEDLLSDDNITEIFCETMLDKEKQYMFLLLNNYENRIVSDPPANPTFYHVGTFINGKLSMESEDSLPVPFPERLKFDNMDEVYDYVTYNVNYKKTQGVIVFTPDNIQYKILNEKYFDLYNVRGNEPSIKFRYLQIRMNEQDNLDLRYLYPKNIDDFEQYENYIFDSSKFIYNSYVDRYIKRIRTVVPTEEFNVMREAHAWYLEDRDKHKITYEKIIEILNKQKATNLNKIIKRLKLANNISEGSNKVVYTHKRLLNNNSEKKM